MKSGRHFLQIPGPTNVPDRVLRAIAQPTIDHRGPAFAALGREVLDGLQLRLPDHRRRRHVSRRRAAARGKRRWSTRSRRATRVLMVETGQFAALWRDMAVKLGLQVEFIPGDWRHGIDPDRIDAGAGGRRAAASIKAVAVVHNETSTGVTSDIPAVRRAIDDAGHPALLLVDAVSSLGAIDYRHDEWRVDVTVSSSQKGLMLPPGLGFNAISAKALAASASARMPRAFWDWQPQLRDNAAGFFPTTPAINLLYGLREAIADASG